jgi:hypothetical protein
MKPEQVQITEINNYRREIGASAKITDNQLAAAIAEVEPWLVDDSEERQELLWQAIYEPGSTI